MHELSKTVAILLLASVLGVVSVAGAEAGFGERPGETIVYSEDSTDPWNRIFQALFVRTVSARRTADLTNDTSLPMTPVRTMGFPDGLLVTAAPIERVEMADRAIEPLYPTTIPLVGLRAFLSGGHYDVLRSALQEALDEKVDRSAMARALMQADVWATYDQLTTITTWDAPDLSIEIRRVAELRPLLARLMRRLALTRQEIEALPDNYSLAARVHPLPRLFRQESGWVELRAMHPRGHEREMDYRRVARVFVKTSRDLSSRYASLEDLQKAGIRKKDLEAAALVLQSLLVAKDRTIIPTRITYSVQVRAFQRDSAGQISTNSLSLFELSRRLLLKEEQSGGMRSVGSDNGVYLPFSGNDFGFATPHRPGGPILGTLHQKCGVCHGFPLTDRFFSLSLPHGVDKQAVSVWSNFVARAPAVAESKSTQSDFLKLMDAWMAEDY